MTKSSTATEVQRNTDREMKTLGQTSVEIVTLFDYSTQWHKIRYIRIW